MGSPIAVVISINFSKGWNIFTIMVCIDWMDIKIMDSQNFMVYIEYLLAY